MDMYDIDYKLKQMRYLPRVTYENISINPGKGIPYKESEMGSFSYDAQKPDFKNNYFK